MSFFSFHECKSNIPQHDKFELNFFRILMFTHVYVSPRCNTFWIEQTNIYKSIRFDSKVKGPTNVYQFNATIYIYINRYKPSVPIFFLLAKINVKTRSRTCRTLTYSRWSSCSSVLGRSSVLSGTFSLPYPDGKRCRTSICISTTRPPWFSTRPDCPLSCGNNIQNHVPLHEPSNEAKRIKS